MDLTDELEAVGHILERFCKAQHSQSEGAVKCLSTMKEPVPSSAHSQWELALPGNQRGLGAKSKDVLAWQWLLLQSLGLFLLVLSSV